MTVLTLPFPVSVNAMFADGRTRRVKSQRYCDWILQAGCALNKQHPKPIKGQVRISYELQDGIDGRKRDCANFEKGVTDLLVEHGVIEADDNTILRGVSIDWSKEVEGIRVTIHRVPHSQEEARES